ncbi:MAG: PAN domain-containing protein [Alphaproteobacteria bacterium]|nr:PAN domain-containing protein [Alphaproteobacteria bacterium]
MLTAVTCAVLALGLGAAQAQTSFDRPGGDYLRISVASGDPEDCAMQCERDRRCRAWTFSYPSGGRGSAMCWLKNMVPPRVRESCCVSGVRGAGVIEPHREGMESSIDRPGGDLRGVDLRNGEGEGACRAACIAETRCRAWTFARPGYVGRESRCFLKKDIKPPRRKVGFISGVVR